MGKQAGGGVQRAHRKEWSVLPTCTRVLCSGQPGWRSGKGKQRRIGCGWSGLEDRGWAESTDVVVCVSWDSMSMLVL